MDIPEPVVNWLVDTITEIVKGVAVTAATSAITVQFVPGKHGDRPVVGPEGPIGRTSVRDGRTIVRFATAQGPDRCTVVTGNIFVENGIRDLVAAGANPVAVIWDEIGKRPRLFQIDLDQGFEVCLPRGRYSFYVLALCGSARHFLDAEIYGIALPSTEDLSDASDIDVDPPGTLADLLSNEPIELSGTGRYPLDMILIDTIHLAGVPTYVHEFLGDPSPADTVPEKGSRRTAKFGRDASLVAARARRRRLQGNAFWRSPR